LHRPDHRPLCLNLKCLSKRSLHEARCPPIFFSDLFFSGQEGVEDRREKAESAMALASQLRPAAAASNYRMLGRMLSHPTQLRAWQQPVAFWERRQRPTLTVHMRLVATHASGQPSSETWLNGSGGDGAPTESTSTPVSPAEHNGTPSSSNGNGAPSSSVSSSSRQDSPSTSAPAAPPGYYAPPPAPSNEPQGGMPHRWKVVAMIAVAFVLGQLHAHVELALMKHV
jgi:hypothetical protein